MREVKQEVPDGREDVRRNKKKGNEPIPEASTTEKDSSMTQFYDELLLAKKHNFQLEQRMQKVEKRPAEAASTLKDAEETIRATCHYLKEQSVIIEAQAKKIKEYEKKDRDTEKRMETQFAKFEEILSKITTDVKDFDSSSGNSADVMKEFKNQLTGSLETSCKNQYDELRGQLNKLEKTLSPENILKEHKNQLELQNTNLKELHDRLNKREASLKKYEKDLLEYAKPRLNEAIEMRRQLEKLSENHQTEMESLKSQMNKIEKRNNEIEEKVQNELEKFGEVQKNGLKKMKDQLSMFLEDVRKQNAKSEAIPVAEINRDLSNKSQKRPAGSTLSNPLVKKPAVISEVNVKSGVQAQKVVEAKKIYCVFCDNAEHHSADCTRFTSRKLRQTRLIEKGICSRCLQPNNKNRGTEHDPCPKANIPCPNCVDEWPEETHSTNHHPLLCSVLSDDSSSDDSIYVDSDDSDISDDNDNWPQ